MSRLAGPGRSSDDVFDRISMIGYERHQARVQVTFAPRDWGRVFVRASWSPVADSEGVDLEVQVTASSVDELKSFEVGILTDCGGTSGERSGTESSWVEPRDAAAAALSFDGRESMNTLRGLGTLPLPGPSGPYLAPWIPTVTGCAVDRFYTEFVQPCDVARRISRGPADRLPSNRSGWSMRYELFGHDIEKGCVLRARLRGHWVRSTSPTEEPLELLRKFLAEPLPLGP